SDNADRALTYSMAIYNDAHKLDRCVEVGERILKEYPETVFGLKVRFILAKSYEKTANFEKSANMYEEFIAKYDEMAGAKAINADAIKEWLKKEAKEHEKDKKTAAAAKPAEKKA